MGKRVSTREVETVRPMPSFLTLIFQSPESFQRQRRPKQRGHLPLRSKPRSGRLALLGHQDLPMHWTFQPVGFYGFSSNERQSIPISYTQQQYCSLSLQLPTSAVHTQLPVWSSLLHLGFSPCGREGVNTRALIYSCA